MSSPELKILFIEDSPEDVELEERELRKGGLVFRSKRVDTVDGLTCALDEFRPDIVISDYSLPHMDGLTALRIVHERRPDLPFIFVSGTLGEERAVNSLKEGATDYVVKERMGRLVHVVLRALQEAGDRTKRRHLEEQFRQSQKMEAIGRLAGGVAHDFNNMLTAILGYGQVALGKLPEGHPVREDVREIMSAGERAASLTRQLLAFSRKQVLQPKVLDLNRVVSDLEKMLRRVIGEHIELRSDLAPSLGRVKADAGQIEQVLLNLVVNARDAMPDGGTLTLTTSNVEVGTAGPGVLLSVRDTGIGMSEEVQSHLFEPFYTTKPPGVGTGLGLSTVYGIVSQSGGKVSVRSEPGKGTTVELYLPRVEAAPETSVAPARPAHPTSGNETVLLVEDADVVRRLLREVLTAQGYRVLEAAEGRQALELSARHEGVIHLLVTDLIMPGMGGRDVADAVRKGRPGIKVLFMSGYAEEFVTGQGKVQEGVPFLAKPFTPDGLARKVREVLDAPA